MLAAGQENARDTAAKVALLEARVAEVAVQRGQLEELIQSLSRSRDENVLVDIEAAMRVALQQTAITGSAEPLVATLKQSDERLARYNQPRLERVRRAVARDLERVQATSVADVATLGDQARRGGPPGRRAAAASAAEPRRDARARPPRDAAAPATAPAVGERPGDWLAACSPAGRVVAKGWSRSARWCA